ncbi:MAG TPA: DUF3307 domain-containing protein [Candidatus Limnocylindrales bacterium]|jgi:hypothetical protein
MSDPILVLAWLVLAHLAADFLFQTGGIVRAKSSHGRQALAGLLAHGAIVAILLIPVGLAFGGPGWLFLAVSAVLHMVVDRSKVLLTRRFAAAALVAAHGRHEGPQPTDHLGRAWTPWPAALFVLDQLVHLAILAIAWAALLSAAPLQPAWIDAVNRVIGGFDLVAFHDVVSALVVGTSLVIANVVGASIFVAILVRPVEQSEGETRWGTRAGPAVAPPPDVAARETTPARVSIETAPPSRAWSVRIGPLETRIAAEPEAAPGPPSSTSGVDAAPGAHPQSQTARVGATIGILERILIVVFVLTGSQAAIGFVVAAKTLARFRLLDDRDFAEYYLLGTLASVSVAIITGLVGAAALDALLV